MRIHMSTSNNLPQLARTRSILTRLLRTARLHA